MTNTSSDSASGTPIILHPPQFNLLAELAQNHRSLASLLDRARSSGSTSSASTSASLLVKPRRVVPFTPQVVSVQDDAGKKRRATVLPGDEAYSYPSGMDPSLSGPGQRNRTYVLPPMKGQQGLVVEGAYLLSFFFFASQDFGFLPGALSPTLPPSCMHASAFSLTKICSCRFCRLPPTRRTPYARARVGRHVCRRQWTKRCQAVVNSFKFNLGNMITKINSTGNRSDQDHLIARRCVHQAIGPSAPLRIPPRAPLRSQPRSGNHSGGSSSCARRTGTRSEQTRATKRAVAAAAACPGWTPRRSRLRFQEKAENQKCL